LTNSGDSSDTSTESLVHGAVLQVGGHPKGMAVAHTLTIKKKKATGTNEAMERLSKIQSQAQISKES
jgi:hypothetical protein